jgi:hypothetical protein
MMDQTGIGSEIMALAEHLVAFEAASANVAVTDTLATSRVCEKLRRPLVTLTGTAGFASLLSRSLTLAKRQAPALEAVQVNPDGTLQGLIGAAIEAQSVLVACLLGLLIIFIGQTLTMRLLHDIWPNSLTQNIDHW